MGAVDVSLGEVELPACSQVLGKAAEHGLEHALLHPLLEPAVARLRRRVATREIGPGGAGAQHPKDAVEHVARIAPRPTALLAGAYNFGVGDERTDERPLLLGQVHPQSQITNGIGRRSSDRRPTVSDRTSRAYARRVVGCVLGAQVRDVGGGAPPRRSGRCISSVPAGDDPGRAGCAMARYAPSD